jgi:uncharacterized membrane protein YraQ (UPF0718 family)
MEFELKKFLEAVGPSASLIFASWIFLSFLQTRYSAAYDRYRALVDERRQHLQQGNQQNNPNIHKNAHQQSVHRQIEIYRKRCEHMRLATNTGVIAAILLIITIIAGGLQVLLPHAEVLRFIGAGSALIGLTLLIVAAAFVVLENTLIKHVMDDEASDLPDLAKR